MKLSKFGTKLTEDSGVLRLMKDLGDAFEQGGDWIMLGGGNPARIPEVELKFRKRMEAILHTPGEFEALIGSYDSPQGNRQFIEALVQLLRARYGWDLTPANVALTAGSQTSFFFLFNLFAGVNEVGQRKKILIPLTPEYIGYADVGIEEKLFVSTRPEIEVIGDDLFKYHVDFSGLRRLLGYEIGAICVSRPTNPTSNVLTHDEIRQLSVIARERDIPLIIDNAYGAPFPHIMFSENGMEWDDHTILTMSLSKLGIPGARTGIVVANEKVVSAISSMNAVVSLTPSSFGAALARDMVATGDVLRMSRDVIRPYYEQKCMRALGWLREGLDGITYRVHRPEGTFFFWLWFDGMPISSIELYERLKARGVLVVPGQYFFPGLDPDTKERWRHPRECIRLNYATDDEKLQAGIKILAEELRKA